MVLDVLRKNIAFLWLEWHFFEMPLNILKAWMNFLKFNLNYFSVPVLMKTFFSPWRRYKMSYGKKIDPARYFEAFTFNSMSRIIGAILRLFFILAGFLVEIIILAAGIVIFFGWILLPFLLIGGIYYGVKLLF